MQFPQRPEEWVIPSNWSYRGLMSLYKLNLGSLGEQQMLLTAELSPALWSSILPEFISFKGQGQGGILIDATVGPGPTLIGDDLEVDPIRQSIVDEEAGVTLQCLIAEDIQAAGCVYKS